MMHHPKIIAIGGLSSGVGKTTLLCQLLKAFPGWEAIKTTRGHYRSCGKDPHACCVSDLLRDEAVLLSGRDATYAPGKDTGHYWEAGAENVHWMIATDEQVERGIKQALALVRSKGVFIEGNSFTDYIDVDAFIMAGRESMLKVKSSARRTSHQASAFYVWRDTGAMREPQEVVRKWIESASLERELERLPVYTSDTFPILVSDLRNQLGSLRVSQFKSEKFR